MDIQDVDIQDVDIQDDQDILDNIDTDLVFLAVVDPESYIGNNVSILKRFVGDKNFEVIYLSLNKPREHLLPMFKKYDLDETKIFFVDAVNTGRTEEKPENCILVGSPMDLTGLGIGFVTALKKTEGKKRFVYLDSLSTMLIYNKIESVEKFAHFLSAQLQRMRINGTMVLIRDHSDKDLLKPLSFFVDKVVKI